jgi:hypothetical protein
LRDFHVGKNETCWLIQVSCCCSADFALWHATNRDCLIEVQPKREQEGAVAPARTNPLD